MKNYIYKGFILRSPYRGFWRITHQNYPHWYEKTTSGEKAKEIVNAIRKAKAY